VLDRRMVAAQVRELTQKERRTLRGLGVRFGAFSVYLPALLTPEARMVCAPFADLAHPGWRPASDDVSVLPRPAPRPEALALRGLRAVAGLAAPIEGLERLDAMARAAPSRAGGFRLTPEALAGLGWAPEQAKRILSALGFAPNLEAGSGEPTFWRRRRPPAGSSPIGPAASLADMAAPAPSARRRAARRRIRRRGAPGLPA
jgi:ATP-dependent RNA helicase SUPV3L1/SUV3